MANDDLAPPKQQIPPTDQQTPTENSSVEIQSGIPVKETADLGQQAQLLDRPKKPPLPEIPPRGVSDQENSSQENPSNTLVKPTAHRAKTWFYDLYGDRQNDPLEHERLRLLKENLDLKASMHSLAILYDTARSNCKKADVDKEKVSQRISYGENFKFLLDPNWVKNERSSLSEENKIWRENREALDANLRELISMLKIASAPDTPVRYNTSTLSLGETIAEELKPYAAELQVITKAFRDNVESHMGILTGINAETMAETQKKKSFWAWLSAATTVVAVASVAYVAGYGKSIRLQRG